MAQDTWLVLEGDFRVLAEGAEKEGLIFPN
jgi:hypothetical protein